MLFKLFRRQFSFRQEQQKKIENFHHPTFKINQVIKGEKLDLLAQMKLSAFTDRLLVAFFASLFL
jgi:hypothetical protein